MPYVTKHYTAQEALNTLHNTMQMIENEISVLVDKGDVRLDGMIFTKISRKTRDLLKKQRERLPRFVPESTDLNKKYEYEMFFTRRARGMTRPEKMYNVYKLLSWLQHFAISDEETKKTLRSVHETLLNGVEFPKFRVSPTERQRLLAKKV